MNALKGQTSDDSDFWDSGGAPKNQRKKHLDRASSIFPSLSEYLSCQEVSRQETVDEDGATSAPKTPNSIKKNESQVDIDNDGVDDIDKEVFDDIDTGPSSSEAEETQSDEEEEDALIDDVLSEGRSAADDLETNQLEKSARERDPACNDGDTEGEDNEILFIDNSRLRKVSQVRKLSVTVSEKQPRSTDTSFNFTTPKEKANIGSNKGNVEHSLVNTILCPPHQLLKYWLYRGRKLLATSDGKMAAEAFIRSFALARIVHGDEHWRTARCKVFLARAYLYLLHFAAQALSHSSEATDAICRALPASLYLNKKPQVHHTLAWAYLVQGEAKSAQSFHQSASPCFSKALHHCRKFRSLVSNRKRLKPSMQIDHPLDLCVRIFRVQAECFLKNNNLLKSRQKLEEAKSLISDCNDDERRDLLLVPILKDLGNLLLRHPGKTSEGGFAEGGIEKDKEEGFEFLRKSLELTQKNKRPGDESECEVRFLIVENQLRYNKASTKDILWELHKLKLWSSRLHGDTGDNTRAIQDCLIQVLLNEGLYPEAIKELKALLQTLRSQYGDYNSHVSGVMRRLASAYLLQNNLVQAIIVLDHCLLVESLVFGATSRRVQTLKMKMQDLLLQVPQTFKTKFLKKHPDLQQKPPFRAY